MCMTYSVKVLHSKVGKFISYRFFSDQRRNWMSISHRFANGHKIRCHILFKKWKRKISHTIIFSAIRNQPKLTIQLESPHFFTIPKEATLDLISQQHNILSHQIVMHPLQVTIGQYDLSTAALQGLNHEQTNLTSILFGFFNHLHNLIDVQVS